MDMLQPSHRRYGPPSTRGPGRPGGDAADQRKSLLDAAIRIYTREGIAAARLRDIAAEAQVTPALIGYYFGGKEQLAQAVVEERIIPAVTTLQRHVQKAGDDVRELVSEFLHAVHEIVDQYPWLPALWMREILNESGALRDVLLKRLAPQDPCMVVDRFVAAQQRGALNADLDPRLLVVSLIGLTFFPLAAESIWRQLFNADGIDTTALLQHTQALLDRGLETKAD